MYWKVVHFLKDESVEAVPTSWVNGNECYWPPLNGMKLKAAISKGEDPAESWEAHKIRVIGGIYGKL